MFKFGSLLELSCKMIIFANFIRINRTRFFVPNEAAYIPDLLISDFTKTLKVTVSNYEFILSNFVSKPIIATRLIWLLPHYYTSVCLWPVWYWSSCYLQTCNMYYSKIYCLLQLSEHLAMNDLIVKQYIIYTEDVPRELQKMYEFIARTKKHHWSLR